MSQKSCSITIEDISRIKRSTSPVTVFNVHKKCAAFFWEAILQFISIFLEPFKEQYEKPSVPPFIFTFKKPKKKENSHKGMGLMKLTTDLEISDTDVSSESDNSFQLTLLDKKHKEPIKFRTLTPRSVPNTVRIYEFNSRLINNLGYDYFSLDKENVFQINFGTTLLINQEILNYVAYKSERSRARCIARIQKGITGTLVLPQDSSIEDEMQLARIRQFYSYAKRLNMPNTKRSSTFHNFFKKMFSKTNTARNIISFDMNAHITKTIDQCQTLHVASAIEFLFRFNQSRSLFKIDFVVKLIMILFSILLTLFTTNIIESGLAFFFNFVNTAKGQLFSSKQNTVNTWFTILIMNGLVWVILYHFVYTFKVYVTGKYLSTFERRYKKMKENAKVFYYIFLTILCSADALFLIYQLSYGEIKLSPIFTIILIICISAALSADIRRIPWNTVIPAYLLQFFLLLLILKTPIQMILESICQSIDALFLKFFDILPNVKIFESEFAYILNGVLLSLMLSVCIELLKYLNILPLVFSTFNFATWMFSVTSIEISYAVGSTFMNYVQLIRLNNNIFRILTNSEIHFFLVASFSNSAAFETSMFYNMGVPFYIIVLFKLASLPGIIAAAKLMYPEGKVSLTSHRGVFPRHNAITHQNRLLTDVWISGLAGGFMIITWHCFSVLIGKAIVRLYTIWFVIPWYIEWKHEATENFYGLSYLIYPIIYSLGVDQVDIISFGRLLLQRFFVSDLFALIDFSKYLHVRWFVACYRKRDLKLDIHNVFMQGRPTLAVARRHNYITKLHSSVLSNRSLFMLVPALTNYNSVLHIIAITAYLSSVLPQWRRRTLQRIVLRASLASLLTNFIFCIMAGFIYSDDCRLFCIEEKFRMMQYEKNMHCNSFTEAMIQTARGNIPDFFDFNKLGGNKINFFCVNQARSAIFM